MRWAGRPGFPSGAVPECQMLGDDDGVIMESAEPSKGEGAREAGILRIWGVPCYAGFGAFGGSRRFCRFRRFGIPIFMHSLGDVWHPGSGVPCFAAFAAFGGSQSHFLPYIFPILLHSLPISSLSSCIP